MLFDLSLYRIGPGKYPPPPGYTAYLTITYIFVSGYKNIFHLKMLEHLFCILVTDIDECWNSCACPTGHGCVNTEGSYEVHTTRAR